MSDENPTTSFMQAMDRITCQSSTIREVNAWEQPTLNVVLLTRSTKLPVYSHTGDSGLDLAASEDHVVEPGVPCKVPLGISVGIPVGFEAQIRPRSSLSAKGLACALGTIDQGYTGELSAVLYNLTKEPITIERGQRVCQLVIAPVAHVRVMEQAELEATQRGDNGWGSSGR